MNDNSGLSKEKIEQIVANFQEFKEKIRETQHQIARQVFQDVDRKCAVMVFAGFPGAGRLIARQLAAMPLPKATVFLEEIGTIKADDMERISQRLTQAMSVGRVCADDLKYDLGLSKPGSRRGRNIKTDESRKARYSQSRK